MAIPQFFKKLLFSRQFYYENGRFYLMMKVPGIILPMHAFVTFVKKYFDDLGESGRKHLFEVGYIQGKEAGSRYAKNVGKSFPKFSEFIKNVAEVMGLGQVKYITKKGDKIEGIFNPSSFAEIYKQKYGETKEPVCYYIAGVAAGVFEPYFGCEVSAVETRCKAKGDGECHFILEKKKGGGKK